MEIIILIGVIVCIFLFFFVSIYNGIISVTNKVNEAFSTMEVYLKKRYELVPNLVQTVKVYESHEKQTLENLVKARATAIGSSNLENIISSNNTISEGLQRVLLIAEAYPDLKANMNFMELQKELTTIEDDIASARKYYNGSVREYNNYIAIFPNLIVARILNKKEKIFFSAQGEERESQKISF